jgi:Glycosyl hydrolases family 2, TIM barrel domain/Glycosyl hydrolases family 2, sugar binding domain/Glycosyl hydrolases family 2
MPMLAGCCLLAAVVIGEAAGGVPAVNSVDRAGRRPALVLVVHTASRLMPFSRALSPFSPTLAPASSALAPASSGVPPAPLQLVSGWQYLADPGNVGLRDGWGQGGAARLGWSAVSMPNDFNPIVSNASYGGSVGWYRLSFKGPPALADRSWNVTFQEVRRNATVWLNGRMIGVNDTDSYSPFSFPLIGLRPGASNVLVARVDNIIARDSFPQDWWNWGGIVQPVSLQPVGRIALSGLGVMGQLGCGYRCGSLLVQGTLQNVSAASLRGRIVVRTTSPGGSAATAVQSVGVIRAGRSLTVGFRVPIRGAVDLWSPSHPALYGVRVSVIGGGRVEQVSTLRTGLRSVRVRAGILYLNGRRLWLHGAAIHEDIRGDGAALTGADIATIVSQLRSAGANITRAHYLLSQRLLDALDAAGILVWEQPPVDHADPVLGTPGGRARALALLRATILGYRSHPSVIVDSVGNELSPTPETTPGTLAYLKRAIPLARSLDPVAPVGLDIYCYPGYPPQAIYSQLDLLGISDYFGWYAGSPGHSIADIGGLRPFLSVMHDRYPAQAIVVSEYGAEGLFDGSADTKGTYEFQSNYLQQTLGVVDQLPFMSGSIYWTLREFAVNPGWVGGAALPFDDPPNGLHHKGLIAYDGSEKPAFAVAQQQFGITPRFVHSASDRSARRRRKKAR